MLESRVNLWVVRSRRSVHLDMRRRICIGYRYCRIWMAHVWRWRIRVAFWWLGWWLRRVSRRRLRSELERGGYTWTIRVINMNPLPSAEFIDIVEIETLDVTLKQGFALFQLTLDALSITSGSESLPMSVLLMA